MDTGKIVTVAKEAARIVGATLRGELQAATHISFEYKTAAEIVTQFDIWAENEVRRIVREHFPEHIIIGEETAEHLPAQTSQTLSEYAANGICWVIDPIDGTNNFANRLPHLAVSIGVLENGKRTVGVAFDPVRDEMFVAVRGDGATLNDLPISVSRKSVMGEAVIGTGFPYDKEFGWSIYTPLCEMLGREARSMRIAGSAVLDQCWVACGRLDAFVEYNLRPWDVAAASLIIEEAGGRASHVADTDPKEFSIFAHSFLYAGPKLHDKLHAGVKAIDIAARMNKSR